MVQNPSRSGVEGAESHATTAVVGLARLAMTENGVTHGTASAVGSPALAMSKGLDRDRAVDETGGQIAVFGRLGSRPFNRSEMEKLFLTSKGVPWKVSDTPDMNRWVAGAGPLTAN